MRRIVVLCSTTVVLMIGLAGWGHPQPETPATAPAAVARYGNADAISQEELKAYEYFLASDQLEGRYFPSRGYDTAALYVASHLAEWGLRPGGSTTGTNGPLQPYFMPIEMVSREIVTEQSKATLTAPGGGGRGVGGRGGAPGGGRGARGADRTFTFDYVKDWIFSFEGRDGAEPDSFDLSGNLVFAGNGYLINKTKTNPYQDIDVQGKIIVVAGLPPELAAQQAAGRGRGAAAAADPLGQNCTDYLTPEEYAARNGALGVVTIANFQTATAMAYPDAGGRGGRGGRGGPSLNGPAFQVTRFQPVPACPVAPGVTAGLELTNAIFQGEKLSGSQVFYANGSNAKEDSFELNAAKKLSLHLEVKVQHGHAENVIGIVDGADPVLKDEFVLISAHLDHIGLSQPQADGHNVNNGADDDGSGSSGLLAVAHAYAEGAAKGMRPRRSLLFLWNGGEERGLLGSQYFTQFPPIDLGKVVADLNMDMIGRTKNAQSVDSNAQHYLVDPGSMLLIGPHISSDDLGQTIDSVNAHYQNLKMDHFYDVTAPDATHDNKGPEPRGQRIFYRSDHYNFAMMGIPIAFFTVGLHADYHRPTDTPDKIDFQEVQSIAKTVAAVGWELANQSGRPKLKDKLPEDLTKDMQAVKAQGWGKVTPVLPPLPGEPF
jgi:hypothetical protein